MVPYLFEDTVHNLHSLSPTLVLCKQSLVAVMALQQLNFDPTTCYITVVPYYVNNSTALVYTASLSNIQVQPSRQIWVSHQHRLRKQARVCRVLHAWCQHHNVQLIQGSELIDRMTLSLRWQHDRDHRSRIIFPTSNGFPARLGCPFVVQILHMLPTPQDAMLPIKAAVRIS